MYAVKCIQYPVSVCEGLIKIVGKWYHVAYLASNEGLSYVMESKVPPISISYAIVTEKLLESPTHGKEIIENLLSIFKDYGPLEAYRYILFGLISRFASDLLCFELSVFPPLPDESTLEITTHNKIYLHPYRYDIIMPIVLDISDLLNKTIDDIWDSKILEITIKIKKDGSWRKKREYERRELKELGLTTFKDLTRFESLEKLYKELLTL